MKTPYETYAFLWVLHRWKGFFRGLSFHQLGIPGSLVRKGDFIEETLGIAQRDDILKNGSSVNKVIETGWGWVRIG
jgi:hypothetical protein